MSSAPRPPLLRRLSPRARTVLAWSGAGLFPLVLLAMVAVGPRDPGIPLPASAYLLPVLVMVLPAGLLWRRPLTGLALLILPPLAVAVAFHPGEGPYLWDIRDLQLVMLDLAAGVIAAYHPRRTAGPALGLALLLQLVCAVYYTPWRPPGAGRPTQLNTAAVLVLGLLLAWQVGRSIRQRRDHTEARRAQAAVQAVQAERLRIARELHDMVAHSIGVIAIQAGVGGRVIETQPVEARNALNAIEDTSRETLAGLRRMLGALRGAEPQAAPLGPSPSLADLDGLVARSLDAGVRVRVRRLGRERPLPADIELSAFRIVQEAVTNVIRHAGTDECRVCLDYRDDELAIEVTDDGPGAAVPGAGFGIAGMRERAGLLRGGFSAGPLPDGGFRVAAELPVPAVAG
ncbi:sensor histidine kinase [Actinoallomurus oryzae]|uniref:histidine kinase n=1 Tax=Actinoallomurus oryzae TaxID=502180 RepID=A0ABP8R8N8_9ACTN